MKGIVKLENDCIETMFAVIVLRDIECVLGKIVARRLAGESAVEAQRLPARDQTAQ